MVFKNYSNYLVFWVGPQKAVMEGCEEEIKVGRLLRSSQQTYAQGLLQGSQ